MRFAPFALALLLAAPAARAGDDGARLWVEACAACHGVDGRGMPREIVGFDDPLPDFTDCRFTNREPDLDWLAVIHDGGPARGFRPMMAALGEALPQSEIESVIAYARGMCRDPSWPRGELNFPRALVTEKAFPEDEAVVTSTFGSGNVGNKLVYEQRFGARNQIELIVPFSWDDSSGAGRLGDVAFGAKRVLYHSLRRGTIFSAAGEVILPTAKESDTAALEPFLSFGQAFPRDSFVQIQTGAELPFDRAKDDEGFFRVAAGRSFVEGRWGRTWSPMVELTAKRELAGGAKTTWDAIPQMQVTLSTRQHIMASAGVRVPLTDRSLRDPEVLVYLLWDWFDGGLFDGW